jgi:hypothetical protein
MTIREELIESGAITPSEDVTELRSLVERPVLRLDAAAREAIRLELAGSVPPAKGDHHALRR